MNHADTHAINPRRPRVLVDVDGVLANFIGAALALINESLGTTHTADDVTEFDFCRALGLRPDVASAIKRRIGATPGFAAGLDVLPRAVAGIRALSAIAEIYIVTSPWNSNPTWTHEREVWLEQRFGIPHAQVIHTSAKHICSGDVLVDDKTETLVRWQAEHPRGIAVQWRTPHNRRDEWNGWSVARWDTVIELALRAVSP